MNGATRTHFVFAFFLLLSAIPAFPQPPALINYQGRLVDGTNLVNGGVGLTLRLFDAPSGGTLLYADSNTVTVVDGLYATYIGDGTIFGDLDAALTNSQVWLEAVVNGTILTPRERIVSVPYARMAYQLNALRVVTNAAGAPNLIGGASANRVGGTAVGATIGGGGAEDYFGTVYTNRVEGDFGTVAGGAQNTILTAPYSSIGGGIGNTIQAGVLFSAISGGYLNNIGPQTDSAFIGGGNQNTILTNATYATIGGGQQNSIGVGATHSTIGGGFNSAIQTGALYATIAGGRQHQIQTDAMYASILGGRGNIAGNDARYAAIGGGVQNTIGAGAWYSTIGGGQNNSIAGPANAVTIAGGLLNVVLSNANYASLGGGQQNVIRSGGIYATIPGGLLNTATNYAFAAGRRAMAEHTGSFVWGDSTDAGVTSTVPNQTTFRSSGGFRIFTSAALTSGVQVAAGSGSWTSISDVNAKEDFAPVDTREVLEKVAALPITTWRYKGQAADIRHMGPTAQDFHTAFGLGDLPGAGITTVDADGVALAAIQALAKENEEFRRQNEELRNELEAIKRHLGL